MNQKAYIEGYMEKLADALSQEDIYQELKPTLPPGTRHVSGGLPDVGGLSDVDLVLRRLAHANMLESLPEGTAPKYDEDHTIYSIPGYDREVNLYVTPDQKRYYRGQQHRATELALAEQFPELKEQAIGYKQEGLGTEPAWGKVLGIDDPYEAMLNKKRMLELAAKLGTR